MWPCHVPNCPNPGACSLCESCAAHCTGPAPNDFAGHYARSLINPIWSPRRLVLGIDTGCVYGGRLTAAIFEGERVTFEHVRARRAYAEWHGPTGASIE